MALLLLSVIAAPLVLSIEPPLIVSVPVPIAVAELMLICPVVSVSPPGSQLLPDSVRAPAHHFCDGPAPLRLLARVTLLPLVSNVAVMPVPID